MKPIKVLYLGSNWEALETLKILHQDNRFEICGVITQPDKPAGRDQQLKPTQIKQYCIDNNISVFHTEKDPEKYKEALDKFKPELIVCKSFGEIMPGFFLDQPRYGTINIHFSLLPKYRGAVPIQKAIMEGDTVTGIAVVKMVEKLDAGGILAMFEEKILSNDTNLSLRTRLVEICKEKVPDILYDWCQGKIGLTEQDETKVTFCWQKEISKDAAQINWETETPERIERKTRALIPWPVAWTIINDKRCQIYEAKIVQENVENSVPGHLYIEEGKMLIGTNNKNLFIECVTVQFEGKKMMKGEEAVRGLR